MGLPKIITADCGHKASLDTLIRVGGKGHYQCADCISDDYEKNLFHPVKVNRSKFKKLMNFLFVFVLLCVLIGGVFLFSPSVIALDSTDFEMFMDMKSDYADKTGNYATTSTNAPDCAGSYCEFDDDFVDSNNNGHSTLLVWGCWIYQDSSGTAGTNDYISGTSATRPWLFWDSGGVTTTSRISAPGNININGDGAIDVWQLHVMKYDGETFTYWLNETQTRNENPTGAMSVSDLYYGCRDSDCSGTSSWFVGRLSACFTIENEAIVQSFNDTEVSEIFELGYTQVYADWVINDPPYVATVQIDNSVTNYSSVGVSPIIEYKHEFWKFRVNFSDDSSVDNVTFVLYNSSGSVMQNFTNTSVSGSQTVFTVYGGNFSDFQNPYNITVTATDDSDDSTVNSSVFAVADATAPSQSGLNDSNVEQDTVYLFNVTFTDEHFFKFNVTCDNGFNDSDTGLNTQSYQYLANITINDTTLCEWHYCDGHTGELRYYWSHQIRNRTLAFRKDYRNEFKLSSNEDVNFAVYKLRDRMKFVLRYLNEPLWTPSVRYHTLIYETEGDGHFIIDDDYDVWIVDDDNDVWFDMNNDRNVEFDVFQINNTAFEITIGSRWSIITFESIGELNCVDLNITLTATPPDIVSNSGGYHAVQFETIPEALFMFFLFIVWLVFFLIAFFVRNDYGGGVLAFNVAQALTGLVLMFNMYAYNRPIALVIGLLSLTMMAFLFTKD